MPRDLVLGNGEILINIDRHMSIRDIYYPYVGWANHVGGHHCRIGVWVIDGGFAWLSDSWDWQIKYETNTLVTSCTARHHGLGIRLHIGQTVLHNRNILLQRIIIENLRENAREVRMFFAHDLRIDESDIGDTAFYYPYQPSLIHYKRDRYFAFAGYSDDDPQDPSAGISQYACGEKGFKGAEGAWRDAEDGLLSMNAIAQGSVDSVASFSINLPAKDKSVLRTWLSIGHNLNSVTSMQIPLRTGMFDSLFNDTREYWQTFVDRGVDISVLPERVADLFHRSLLIIRTQTDKRGAIIASNDSDIMDTARAHYSYMWPRDGALAAAALDQLDVKEVTRPFFEFCMKILPSDRAAFLHKYGPDGTMGASWHPWIIGGEPEIPFQEDGTALVVWAVWKHYERYKDDEYSKQLYTRLVVPAAEFMAAYRDAKVGLPLPSWDLWEERRGTHVFTTAAVIAALNAAAKLAAAFEDTQSQIKFQRTADEMKEAFLSLFWNEELRHFVRMVNVQEDGSLDVDSTMDASSYAIFAFDVLPANDPKVVSNMQEFGKKLWVKVGVGGVARYQRDWYFHVTQDFENVPGNPWLICTLWLADWYIAVAKSKEDLKPALDLLEWTAVCALRTGILSEQVHPFTLQQLSVSPLTWSHAQFLTSCLGYLDKWKEYKPRTVGS